MTLAGKLKNRLPGPEHLTFTRKAVSTVQFSQQPSPGVAKEQGGGRASGWHGSVLIRAIVLTTVTAGAICYLLLGNGHGADDSLSTAQTESSPPGSEPREPHPETTDLPNVASTKFAVSIRKPLGPPRVATGLKNADGTEVTVACSTCHTTRLPNHHNKTVKDLDEFHGGTVFSHGTVSCLSCHNERDYDTLRLADGSRVEFSDVMKLCAQCHGPQMKAYEHGSHGGMNGYWDLTRGPQTKNNCIDCHNPHAPQFPKMRPTFKPKDRFIEQPRTTH